LLNISLLAKMNIF